MQPKEIRPTAADQSGQLNVDSRAQASELADASALVSTDQFEDYQLLSSIHSGRTGDVFKVQRTGMDKIFALKTFKTELLASPGTDERFERECQAIGALTHENLVPLYEQGTSMDGKLFIVTDFVSGINLQQLIQSEGCLNDARVLDISLQLCSLLDYLEQKGIAARGLNLSDVLLTKNATDTEIIKVVDLGISKLFESTTSDTGTTASPSSDSPADAGLTMESLTKSFSHPDVRMLGGLMFELLIGKSLAQTPNANQALLADDPARATRIVLEKDHVNLKRDLRLIVAGALQMPGVTQYRTIQDLRSVLERLAKGEAIAPAKPMADGSETGIRKKLLTGIAGVVFAGAILSYPFLAHNNDDRKSAVTKAVPVPVAQPKTYSGSQQIKDKYGRILYASNAPDQSACVNEALRLGVNLAGAQIADVHLGRVKIANTSLAAAHFKNCSCNAWYLSKVNLDGVTFSDCTLTHVKFNNDSMTGANFKNCTLNSTTFTDTKLRDAKFEDCDTGTTARYGSLSGVTINSSSELNGMQLIGGNWSYCKLLSAMPNVIATFNLTYSIISCNSLSHADFSGATVVSSKIVAPDANTLKFKILRDTTIEQRLPTDEKDILHKELRELKW